MAPKIKIVSGGGSTWSYSGTQSWRYSVKSNGTVLSSIETVNAYCRTLGQRLDFSVYQALGTESDADSFNATHIGIAWDGDTPIAALQFERTWVGPAGPANTAAQASILGAYSSSIGGYRVRSLGSGGFYFAVVSNVSLTFNNSQSPVAASISWSGLSQPITVNPGSTYSGTVESGTSVSVSHSNSTSYEKHFTSFSITIGTQTTTQYDIPATFTVTGATSVVSNWTGNSTATFKAPAYGSLKFKILWDGVFKQEKTLSPGTSATVYINPSGSGTNAEVQALPNAGYTFNRWRRNNTDVSFPSSASGTLTDLIANSTYSYSVTSYFGFTVSVPSGGKAVTVNVSDDGKAFISNQSVQPGQTRNFTTSTYDPELGVPQPSIQIEIAESDFDYRAFGGWTRNGTVIDRWSNPHISLLENNATYAYLIETPPGPTPSGGNLIFGTSGALLFADQLPPKNVSVSISASYVDSGHYMTWAVQAIGGTQLGGSDSGMIQTSFSKTASVGWSAGPSASDAGKLLFADEVVHEEPRLVRVMFHCDHSFHKFDASITVNGTVYRYYGLSGTFSHTYEV